MAVVSTYIDIFAFLRATTGLETASLIGNKGRLSSAVIAGATSLPVIPAITVSLNQFDQVTIFDGQNSEVVQVGAGMSSASTIPLLQPLSKGHAQYTTFCTDGASGSLADEIVNASAWIENICQQSLFQQTYTDETLDIPSMNASIDNQGTLVFAPRHFPVTAETGITIKSNNQDPIDYDASQVVLDTAKQVVSVPWLSVVGSSSSTWQSSPAYSRQQSLFLLVDYTAGWNPIPPDVHDAAILRTSAILARRQNTTGAVSITMGKRSQNWVVGGRAVNQMNEEAKNILTNNYIRRV